MIFRSVKEILFAFRYFNNVECLPVSNIDSILINGEERKQIHFQEVNSITEKWIEGIGSTMGWFEWNTVGTWSYELLCYKEKNQKLYSKNLKEIKKEKQ